MPSTLPTIPALAVFLAVLILVLRYRPRAVSVELPDGSTPARWVPERGEFVAVTYPNRNLPARIMRVQQIEYVGSFSESGYLAKFEGLPPLDLHFVEKAALHYADFAPESVG
jgi:hypothetical protein